jgi:hypothetical protein
VRVYQCRMCDRHWGIVEGLGRKKLFGGYGHDADDRGLSWQRKGQAPPRTRGASHRRRHGDVVLTSC